ncbi:thiamine pyrophosphokinase [Exophiala dermatitidis]|nr:thiamine pyrophosphokinase [Exophiala dermatitidis]KAJ4557423.1 thiamine pyrophosphokinase [Exophiala dermatitidis]
MQDRDNHSSSSSEPSSSKPELSTTSSIPAKVVSSSAAAPPATDSNTTTAPPPVSTNTTVPEWHPTGLLSGHPTRPYAIIILNQPINYKALDAVIDHADLLVCADAGADRLYKYHQQQQDQQQQHLPLRPQTRPHIRLPDAIVGDLDSLSPQVEHHYRAQGVQVIKDPNQYSTDFTKCLKWIRRTVEHSQQSSLTLAGPQECEVVMDVVVLGGLGGRVDQAFSQIHHLYMASNDSDLLVGRIYLLSESSLSFVLAEPDSDSTTPSSSTTTTTTSILNIIHVPESKQGFSYFEENVGIIPVLGRCHITTTGLEWDVEDWPTEFGGQMRA